MERDHKWYEVMAWKWLTRIRELAPYNKSQILLNAGDALYAALHYARGNNTIEARKYLRVGVMKCRRHNHIVVRDCRISVLSDSLKYAEQVA